MLDASLHSLYRSADVWCERVAPVCAFGCLSYTITYIIACFALIKPPCLKRDH